MSAALATRLVVGKRYLVGGAVLVPSAVAIGVLGHSTYVAALCVVSVTGVALKGTLARKARAVALAELVGDPQRYHETWEYRRGERPSARVIGTSCARCGTFVARRAEWVAGIAPLPKKTGLPDGVAPARGERTIEHRYCADCGLPWITVAAVEPTAADAAPEPVPGKRMRRNPFLVAFVALGILGFLVQVTLDVVQRAEARHSSLDGLVGAAPMGVPIFTQHLQTLRIGLQTRHTLQWWRVQAGAQVTLIEQDAEGIESPVIRTVALREAAALRQLQRAEVERSQAAVSRAVGNLVRADRRLMQFGSSG